MTFIATFKVPVPLFLNHEQIKEAHAALNTYYLGDSECNFLNPETMQYEPKYPEKENKDFQDSMSNVKMTHTVFLTVGLDSKGCLSVIQ